MLKNYLKGRVLVVSCSQQVFNFPVNFVMSLCRFT
uniref:Uncharacterized protein n=1 Tax=Anguilla anguilla TaxID=7936 RepID=A0A0E9W7X6_ANGAN